MKSAAAALLALVCGLAHAADAPAPVYWSEDGVVAIEVESHSPSKGWAAERDMAGFSGDGYYTWRGGRMLNSPGHGLLAYRLRLSEAGRWELRIRNRHDFHDHTENNDVFVRIDGGEWIKTFSSKRGEWTWQSRFDYHKGKPLAGWDLSAGEHLLEISGRSEGMSIDRIHLYREGASGAEDHARRESRAGVVLPDPTSVPEIAQLAEAGALGRALSIADKNTDDAAAREAAEVLRAHAASESSRLEALLPDAPKAALTGMAELANAYRGSDLGRELQDRGRGWQRDDAVRAALEAEALASAIRDAVGDLRGEPKDESFQRSNARAIEQIAGAMQRLKGKHAGSAFCKQAEGLLREKGLLE